MVEMTVTDADAHFFEPTEKLLEYVDDSNPWKDRLARQTESGVPVSYFPSSTGDRFIEGRIEREDVPYPYDNMEPEQIPEVMDNLGFDNIVLLSHLMLAFSRMQGDDERMEIVSNAYIDYMLDHVVDPDEGIYCLLAAPFNNPEESKRIIDRVGSEEGVVGIALVTAGPEPPLGNRRYDPIYEAAERNGLPIVFHAGGAGIDEFHKKGYEKFTETHVLGFLENNMSQCVSIVIQGVPVRYPDLDIVFQESGIYWVPMIMQRLDAEYMKRPSEVPILDQRPSDYMKEFYYGTQPLEEPRNPEYLRQIVDQLGGAERLIYASDYPHWDYDPPNTISENSAFTDEEKRAILGENAQEVFGI